MKTKFKQARKKERETEKDREREVSKLVFYTQSQREGKKHMSNGESIMDKSN